MVCSDSAKALPNRTEREKNTVRECSCREESMIHDTTRHVPCRSYGANQHRTLDAPAGSCWALQLRQIARYGKCASTQPSNRTAAAAAASLVPLDSASPTITSHSHQPTQRAQPSLTSSSLTSHTHPHCHSHSHSHSHTHPTLTSHLPLPSTLPVPLPPAQHV